MSVEINGFDVTERVMRGETIYWVPKESSEPVEPTADEWPEGWQVMGAVQE